MKCLVVIAHPLEDSLCQSLARTAIAALAAQGHEVTVEDLYATGFSPVLTPDERRSYYGADFDATATQEQCKHLRDAEALVLLFPTWWFSFPAMLKGWFDRVWAPGVAYDHATDLGPIRPRLHNLRHAIAITTLGSPRWVDLLVMRQPVKRVLKTALLGTCAPQARFDMLSLYKAESLTPKQVQEFCERIDRSLSKWA